MPATPKHRGAIIDAAIRLFRKKGYSATGLNDIVALSGAPKGSLYYYFPKGKASIAEAAVELAGESVVKTLREVAASVSTAGQLLHRHAELLSGWLEKSAFRDGCPITTVLLELAPQDRAVTAAGRKAYAARIDCLAEKLMADGHPEPDARNLAVLCNSAMQGALVQARVERSSKPILTTANELSFLLTISPKEATPKRKAA
jgi:TetR/AcrR family transcriptional repressor of lmrAB and yxaGH operons